MTSTSVVHDPGQLLLVTFKSRLKLSPQALPATTVTVWELLAPEIVPLPEIDQAYAFMPAGPANCVLDFGQTCEAPLIEQVGRGITLRIMSLVSVQPLFWTALSRSVAEADDTYAVVTREFGASMVANPLTTLHVVDEIGARPGVAEPFKAKVVTAPSVHRA